MDAAPETRVAARSEGSGADAASAARVTVLVGACIAASLLLWAPVIGTWFVGDDLVEVGEAVQAPPAGRLTGDLRLFRPLFHLSLWVDHGLWGTSSAGYHVTGAVLHGAVAAAVGLLGRRLWAVLGPEGERAGPGGWTVAAVAAAVFVVHPSHTEAVAWISARSDLLAALFATLCLLAWTHRPVPGPAIARSRSVIEDPGTTPGPASRNAGGNAGGRAGGQVAASSGVTAAAVLALAAALAAKESAAAVPAVAALWEAFRAPSGRRLRSTVSTWPLWLTLAVYAVVRLWVRGAVEGYGTAGVSLPRLVARALAVPARSVLPALPAAAWVGLGLLALGAVVVSAAGVVARLSTPPATPRPETPDGGPAAAPRGPAALLGFLSVAVVVLAVPVLLLGVSLTTPSGERVVYLPSVLGSILVAVLLCLVIGRRRTVGIALTGVVLLAGAATTLLTELRWRDSAVLARSTVEPFASVPAGRTVYLLNQPGSTAGVVTARNSLPSALEVLVRGRPRPEVVVVATQDSPRVDQRVAVGVVAGERGTTVSLRSPRSSFGSDGTEVRPRAGAPVRILRSGDEELEVLLPAQVDLRDVWYVDRGRLRRLR